MIKDNVINVPNIAPHLKHLTIFTCFDALKPGESLIIKNDHDPKPLYFQLVAQRGEIFEWDYLEDGPTQWQIQVTKHA